MAHERDRFESLREPPGPGRFPDFEDLPGPDGEEESSRASGLFEFVVDRDGERLDRFLSDAGPWSRTFAQDLIARGCVRVDGDLSRSSRKLSRGQTVRVEAPPPRATLLEPEPIPLDVYFEDSDLIVVNKPRGMVVHPGHGHERGTLVAALLHRVGDLSGIGGVTRPGIVHRIDKDTSGLLVAAKTDLAHAGLSDQFRRHTVTRRYRAIVHGSLVHPEGTVDAPLGRDLRDRRKMAVVAEGMGRNAVTHFRVLERFSKFTVVELRLMTGRTHQIRVHMAYIGHPVAGDPLYAARDPLKLGGQALHAETLGFDHPRSGERLEFRAPLPEEFEKALRRLGD